MVLPSVCETMGPHLESGIELLQADVAFHLLVSSMPLLVALQRGAIAESHIAQVASVRLGAFVDNGVSPQGAVALEGLVALGALIRTLSRVGVEVFLEDPGCPEGLRAIRTIPGRMCGFMPCQLTHAHK